MTTKSVSKFAYFIKKLVAHFQNKAMRNKLIVEYFGNGLKTAWFKKVYSP